MNPESITDQRIGYGIIGTGMMGVEHIHNLKVIDRAEVVAISDPDDGSRQAGLDAVSGEGASANIGVFADHQDLLNHPGLDAVVIASPNHTHRDVLLDVVASGVHVLVEKPMCVTIEQCLDVQAAVDRTMSLFPERVVQVGLEYRYMPPVARLIEEVAAGTVGKPRMVSIREHRFPFLEKVGNWNRFSVNTGGTLVEKCCHFFDLMNLIIGDRPVRVMASGGQDVNHLDEVYNGQPSDILDNAFVIVDYASGARAMLDLCMFAEATRNQEELSVVGPLGKVEALIPDGIVRVGIRGRDEIGMVADQPIDDSHIPYAGFHHGSSYLEHLDFIAAIDGQRSVPVTVEDGLWSVLLGVAAHRSIEEGRPIDVASLYSQNDGVVSGS